MESKPPKSSWFVDEKVGQKIEALQAYAVDACSDEQRRLAGNVISHIPLSNFSIRKYRIYVCNSFSLPVELLGVSKPYIL